MHTGGPATLAVPDPSAIANLEIAIDALVQDPPSLHRCAFCLHGGAGLRVDPVTGFIVCGRA